MYNMGNNTLWLRDDVALDVELDEGDDDDGVNIETDDWTGLVERTNMVHTK